MMSVISGYDPLCCQTSIMSCILVFLFCLRYKFLLKYDFWHSHIFVSVYAVVIKVQPFESAYNGAYKELNFICQQCFLTHVLHFKCRFSFWFTQKYKITK